MSDITVINDSEQSSLVTNGLAKNGELYLKASGSTDEGAIVVYDSGSWRTFANEVSAAYSNTYSVSFDGSNDYIDTGSTFQSTIRGGFTYSFWMKWSSLGTGAYAPFGSWDDSADQNTVYISNPASNGTLNYRLEFGSPKITLTGAPTGGWNTSDWFHIAMSVQQDGSNVAGKLYINGVKKIEGSAAGALNSYTSSRSIYIGARNRTNGSNIYFPGLIDEVAIFGSALSDGGVSNGQTAGGDIATLYNSGVPDDISSFSPVAHYRMGDNDSGTGTTITDQGSGGNDGTLTNGPTFSSSVPS